MSDTALFKLINGLAGKVPAFDEFFKGISNDYFALICACLILIWLWFGARSVSQRERNQRAFIIAMISVGLATCLVILSNQFYFRIRPFNALPAGSVDLLFYRPTDSSFPSNFAATIFAIAVPIFFYNRKYGAALLVLAAVSSFGRVFMGVHYPLDVLGGAAMGILAGFLACAVSRVLRPVLDYVLNFLQRIYLA